jgi:cation:H+ antiporter
MFDAFSLPALLAIFTVAAGAVWFAGVKLSEATDILADRLHLGEALAGLILLAIATNLPEIAITASAAWSDDLGIAIGNIFGGISIQTVVLVLLDVWGLKGRAPLSYQAASLTLVLEGVLVISVLTVAIMASRLPAELVFARLAPGDVVITLLWIFGLWLIGKARKGLPWQAKGDALGGQETGQGASRSTKSNQGKEDMATGQAAFVFAISALVTLIAGVGLERTSNAIAGQIGMSGVLFGATILAAFTALPEISTGLAAVRLGDYKLAVSDIFGGNAFLPVLFLPATLISGKAALPQAQGTDIYLAGLGILLTCAYLCGLISRPQAQVLGMGLDSLAVLILYLAGLAGLAAIALLGR